MGANESKPSSSHKANRHQHQHQHNAAVASGSSSPSVEDEVDEHSKVWRIVITGGPVSGQTTAITRVRLFLENRGFFVYTLPSSPDLLRGGGISYTSRDNTAFQSAVLSAQYSLEQTWLEFARRVARRRGRPAVVLMSRGLLGGKAYVGGSAWQDSCREAGVPDDDDELAQRYDAVFHLVTAASGALSFFHEEKNKDERGALDAETAVRIDRALQRAWQNHPGHVVLHSQQSFEEKMTDLIHRLCLVLGVKDTSKIPRRFLLSRMPGHIPVANAVFKNVLKIYIGTNSKGRISETDEQGSQEFTFIKRSYFENDNGRPSSTRPAYGLKMVTHEEGQNIARAWTISREQFSNQRFIAADDERHLVRQRRIGFSTDDDVFFEIVQYLTPHPGLVLLNVHLPDSQAAVSSLVWPDFLKSVLGDDVTQNHLYSAHYLSLKDQSKWRRYSLTANEDQD